LLTRNDRAKRAHSDLSPAGRGEERPRQPNRKMLQVEASHEIARNGAIPFAVTDFIGAFEGAQASPQQEGITRA